MRRAALGFLALAILPFFAATNAHAGAWTQDPGHGQVIVNGYYYSTDRLFDNQGHRQSQPDFSKEELNPYMEYGVADGLTAGANLSLQRASQETDSNWGIGDSEFFLRKRLWQQGGFVLSAEPMVKLPSPESKNSLPPLGGSHPDAGMGFAAGYGFDAFGLHHFIDLDAGYHYRFGPPKDQLLFGGTLGIALTPKLMLMPQAFATYRTAKPAVTGFTNSSGDDYDLLTLQLSLVYKVNDATSFQLGGFSHVEGKNAGGGDGALVSAWRNF